VNNYKVLFYANVHDRSKAQRKFETVRASSATEALMNFLRARQYDFAGQVTHRHGNDPDESRRDNAHLQFDADGRSGLAACREEHAADYYKDLAVA